MNRIVFGLLAGLAFGIVDVLLMIPLEIPDKKTAMIGAFLDRFAIGFLIPLVDVEWSGWLRGLMVGLIISLPSAVITKAYGPILGVGAVGGEMACRTPDLTCWGHCLGSRIGGQVAVTDSG